MTVQIFWECVNHFNGNKVQDTGLINHSGDDDGDDDDGDDDCNDDDADNRDGDDDDDDDHDHDDYHDDGHDGIIIQIMYQHYNKYSTRN